MPVLESARKRVVEDGERQQWGKSNVRWNLVKLKATAEIWACALHESSEQRRAVVRCKF